MKKIFLLFFSAALSFLIFSYIDEYENIIAPLFKSNNNDYAVLFTPEEDKVRMRAFLTDFNNMLFEAYRMSDPSKISGLPLSNELKEEIAGEINFLKKDRRAVDMVIRDLTVIKINRPSQSALEVHAREKVGIRYLSGDGPQASGSYMEREQAVTYRLTIGTNGVELSSYEITSVKDLG